MGNRLFIVDDDQHVREMNEVSFKLEDYEGEREGKTDLEIVNELREKLRTKLNEGGYLIERNGLKTNSVLERY